ncbi:hypothetical protein [Streptomyces sp. NPDC057413]|uniref:hypothetical protein n=1 Tax=Streptomyces sp. NPDC057413 TaxID=3346124 RepID=UPI00367EEA12
MSVRETLIFALWKGNFLPKRATELLDAYRAEVLAEPRTDYRASHDSIVMGHYSSLRAAQQHCEVEACVDIVGDAALDWIEDEEDGVFELVAETADGEFTTGYVVTAVEVASEYDEEADE